MYSLTQICQLLTGIARSHQVPKGQEHKRLNSFALLSSFNDLNSSNAANNIVSAQSGLYWTRKGVSLGNDKLSYGALILMQRSAYKKKMNDKTKCLKLTVGVALPKICKKCPKGQQTQMMAEMCAEDVLMAVMDSFVEIKHYKLSRYNDKGVKETQHVLLHPKQLECYPDWNVSQDCGNVCSALDSQRSDIYVKSGTGIDDLTIAYTEITICDCYSEEYDFDFNWCTEDKEGDPIGMVKCDTCDW